MEENHNHKERKKDTLTVSKLTLWKGISGLLGVLLLISIFTGGFGLGSQGTSEETVNVKSTVTKGNSIKTGIDVSGRVFKGVEDAKVTIIEYSSFSCGYCNRARGTIDQIIETYPEDIKLIYKHFNRGGTDSQTGQATECAGDQGKFWEMHDMIFDNGASNLNGYAESLGLDTEEFSSCLSTSKYASRIDEDSAEGRAAGVSGTPTFFINGQKLVGAQPFSAFKQIIDDELSK